MDKVKWLLSTKFFRIGKMVDYEFHIYFGDSGLSIVNPSQHVCEHMVCGVMTDFDGCPWAGDSNHVDCIRENPRMNELLFIP